MSFLTRLVAVSFLTAVFGMGATMSSATPYVGPCDLAGGSPDYQEIPMGDLSEDISNPTFLSGTTRSLCGMYSEPTSLPADPRDLDYFEFTELNPGVNTFDIFWDFYDANGSVLISSDLLSSSATLKLQGLSAGTDGSIQFMTDVDFGGGSLFFGFTMGSCFVGQDNPACDPRAFYAVKVTEAAPIPLPPAIGFAILGLGALGAVRARRKAA